MPGTEKTKRQKVGQREVCQGLGATETYLMGTTFLSEMTKGFQKWVMVMVAQHHEYD